METDLNPIIERIRKCLALSESTNVNEAAIALKQAQALMKKYSISKDDIDEAEFVFAEVDCIINSDTWMQLLNDFIFSFFNCTYFYSYDKIKFIGHKVNVELAKYTHQRLYALVRKARKEYRKTIAGQDKIGNKADEFCMGWIAAIRNKINIRPFYSSPIHKKQREIVERKFGISFGDEKLIKFKQSEALEKGYEEGSKVEINTPLDTSTTELLN